MTDKERNRKAMQTRVGGSVVVGKVKDKGKKKATDNPEKETEEKVKPNVD
jgi:hypothetical protein